MSVQIQTDHPDAYYDSEREVFVQPDGTEVTLYLKEFERLQECRAAWGKLPVPTKQEHHLGL